MRHVPDESLSRVSAYDWFGSLAFQPLGLVIWGPIAAVIGLSPALWLAAALVARDDGVAARRCRRSVTCASTRFRPDVMRTCVRAVRRAPRPHRLLLPGRRVLARGAGGGGGGAGAFGRWRWSITTASRGRWSSRMAAKPLGLRAIHGVEMDLDGRAARHAAGRERGGVAEPVPDRHARASCTTGSSTSRRRRCRWRRWRSSRPGWCCLSGCADHGVHDEPTLRRLLAAFGPDHLRVELQRPFQRHDRSRNRELAQLAQAAGGADGGDRQRARPRAHARAAAGRVRRAAPSPDAGRVGAGAARQHRARAVDAAGDGGALRGPRGGGGGERGAGRAAAFDLTQDLGYRYPGAEDAQAPRKLAELCWAMLEVRYPAGPRTTGRRMRG